MAFKRFFVFLCSHNFALKLDKMLNPFVDNALVVFLLAKILQKKQ